MAEHCEITDKENVRPNASHYEQATHNMFVSLSHSYLTKNSASIKELFTVLCNGNIGCEFTVFDNRGGGDTWQQLLVTHLVSETRR
jgi:hypothetical protein